MNAIGINFIPVNELKIGQSKLGGNPDLPNGFSFPKNNNGTDIPFLCQLNLAEFKNEIASDGILYFFCQLDDTTEYGAVLFSKETNSLTSVKSENVDTEYMEIEYPLSEKAISFEEFNEVSSDDENYYDLMGGSRVGGSILKAGADHGKDGRVSLFQLNSNEVEELQDEIEEYIHFFIDLSDLKSLIFDNVFVTSQH